MFFGSRFSLHQGFGGSHVGIFDHFRGPQVGVFDHAPTRWLSKIIPHDNESQLKEEANRWYEKCMRLSRVVSSGSDDHFTANALFIDATYQVLGLFYPVP